MSGGLAKINRKPARLASVQRRNARLMAEAEARARRLLAERRPDIERIARVLAEKRELDAAAISALLSDIPRDPDHTQYEGCETGPVAPYFVKETPDAHPF